VDTRAKPGQNGKGRSFRELAELLANKDPERFLLVWKRSGTAGMSRKQIHSCPESLPR